MWELQYSKITLSAMHVGDNGGGQKWGFVGHSRGC